MSQVFSYIFSLVLVALSGLFSGLTLGLMSLDLVGLEIVANGEDQRLASYAKKIMPIRKRGNLLLCTLLLGNVMVNAELSILMADFTGGLAGFLISTALIVIFGEIVPQSLCSRHGLAVGAHTLFIVKFFLVLLLPISYPISRALDKLLGEEMGTIYRKQELKTLVNIHAKSYLSDLKAHEEKILVGALSFREKAAASVMTPIDHVTMIDINAHLGFDELERLFRAGHSRVPVYENNRNNIIGILYTKDLILLDPDDNIPVRALLSVYKNQQLIKVWPDTTLGVLLTEFKKGKGHLAVVTQVIELEHGDPMYENVGIITLEDLIEEIIQDEIVDETDVYLDEASRLPIPKAWGPRGRRDLSLLSMFQRKNRSQVLSDDESAAICAFLSQNITTLGNDHLSADMLKRLVEKSVVLESSNVGDKLYRRGEATTHCMLILQGKLHIRATSEGFMSERGPWSLLCESMLALPDVEYRPDFDATVLEAPPFRALLIRADDYINAIRGTRVERGEGLANIDKDVVAADIKKVSSHVSVPSVADNLSVDSLEHGEVAPAGVELAPIPHEGNRERVDSSENASLLSSERTLL